MEGFDYWAESRAWFTGLVEGEGSFHIASNRGRFKLEMTDEDVMLQAQKFLLSLGIDIKLHSRQRVGSNGKLRKRTYILETSRWEYLTLIIDKCYEFFSEKKRTDCIKVLNNLTERGLLGESSQV